jgi:hypothetical protein
MAQIVRYCSDCSGDRPYEQQHDVPGGCPDSADGECVEWSCTACGTAVLIGFGSFALVGSGAVGSGAVGSGAVGSGAVGSGAVGSGAVLLGRESALSVLRDRVA